MNKHLKEDQLLFIISQPRSGSTMLQAVLSNHSEIDTVSEPWILLPFLSVYKPSIVKAEYNYSLAMGAVNDFIEKTDQVDELKQDLKKMILNRYAKIATADNNLVLDKTPRYYEIVDLMMDMFPQAKFILLKRHPVAVLSSIMKTWKTYSFKKLSFYKRDIFKAPYLIYQWEQEYGDRANVKVLKYEDLLANSESEIQSICQWLNIDYDAQLLNYAGNKSYLGIYGDPTGIHANKAPEKDNMEKWKQGLSESGLKDYLNGYGGHLGKEFLKEYGYKDDVVFKPNLKFKSFNYYCHKTQSVASRSYKDLIISFLIRNVFGENI